MTATMSKVHIIYGLQTFLVLGISIGAKSINFDNYSQWVPVARYIFYFLIMQASKQAITILYNYLKLADKPNLSKLKVDNQKNIWLLGASMSILYNSGQKWLGEDFALLFIAYIIVKYPEMDQVTQPINYGTGMACSFFEGYLAHVIPSDGARFVGFEENIRVYESRHGVVFPVRRLFIIITKSLFSPPDLKHFNKARDDVAHLEACQSLEDVEKDVAGVKNRTYRNSAYQIRRPGKRPVYLAAECATPLHTLHRVLKNRELYEELSNINVKEVVHDFCTTLTSIISKSHEAKGKCELVYYDDENPDENLADILLERIRLIEPDFENIKRE